VNIYIYIYIYIIGYVNFIPPGVVFDGAFLNDA